MKKAFAALLVATLPFAAAAQERAVVKVVTVKAPVEAVWKAWTTTEGIKCFFAPDARIEARPGGPFEVYFNPYAKPGAQGRGRHGGAGGAGEPDALLHLELAAAPGRGPQPAHRVTLRFSPRGRTGPRSASRTAAGATAGSGTSPSTYFDTAWGNVLANLEKRFVEGPIDWSPFLKQMKAYQDAEDAKEAAGKKP